MSNTEYQKLLEAQARELAELRKERRENLDKNAMRDTLAELHSPKPRPAGAPALTKAQIHAGKRAMWAKHFDARERAVLEKQAAARQPHEEQARSMRQAEQKLTRSHGATGTELGQPTPDFNSLARRPGL